MKLKIITIGKVKEKFLTEGIDMYLSRISRFADVSILELPETLLSKTVTEATVIRTESERLLEKATGYKILLDVEGTNITSPQLASVLNAGFVTGGGTVSVIIGGSWGVDAELKAACDYRLSFGKMTFPHQLMRLVALEQLYRAFTIINNIPYHK